MKEFKITKELLISVIKEKGDCSEIVESCMGIMTRCCQECDINEKGVNGKTSFTPPQRRYTNAVDKYVKLYGEENLFEELL